MSSSSPGRAHCFSSPRRAAFAPCAHFPINRRAREAKEGLEGPEGQELREEGKNKKKEEETRPKRYRIATTIILYFVSCSAFFVRAPVSFYF